MKNISTAAGDSGSKLSRGFLIITAGQAISLIGSSAAQFALIWWLTTETGSALVLSVAGLVAFLPQMLVGPFAGVWIDRLKRKTVIICADLFIASAAAIFALWCVFGTPPFWAGFVILGLRALGSVFHTPAIQAAIPMLVPQDQLLRANSISQFLQSGSVLLGPVLGGVLYMAMPLYAVMFTDVFGAVIACSCVALVRIPDPPRQDQELPHVWREMKQGFLLLVQNRRIFIITLATTACMIFFLPVSTLYPLMTSFHFRGDAAQASVVEFAYAFGMLVATGALSVKGEVKRKFALIHVAMAVMGAAMLACGLLPASKFFFWIFAALCCVLGGSCALYTSPYYTCIQQAIPPQAQGRVFSSVGSLMSFAMPVGLVAAGPVAERFGVVVWFFIAGGATLAIAMASVWLTRERKVHGSPEPLHR